MVRKRQRTLKKNKILLKMVHIMQKMQELLETTDSNVTLGSKFNPPVSLSTKWLKAVQHVYRAAGIQH